jgi:hypothetical protein
MRIGVHTSTIVSPLRSPGHVVSSGAASSSSSGSAAKVSVSPATSSASEALFASLFGSYTQAAASTAPTATASAAAAKTLTTATATAMAAAATTTATTATTAATTAAAPADTTTTPGIQALVGAMLNGSFQATYVTDPTQLKEVSPVGTDTMPNFYYLSNDSANQMAQLLGGKVVQMPAFGQDTGWTEPLANFIQLPNGQTFNAADVAYYTRCSAVGGPQLTADITQTINEGAAWSNYYKNGGPLPSFAIGYIGPAISGMTYPAGSVAADGNVINPATGSSS